MLYIWGTLLVLLNAIWLALVMVGVPGNWLMVLSAALLSWRLEAPDGGMFSLWTLGGVLASWSFLPGRSDRGAPAGRPGRRGRPCWGAFSAESPERSSCRFRCSVR